MTFKCPSGKTEALTWALKELNWCLFRGRSPEEAARFPALLPFRFPLWGCFLVVSMRPLWPRLRGAFKIAVEPPPLPPGCSLSPRGWGSPEPPEAAGNTSAPVPPSGLARPPAGACPPGVGRRRGPSSLGFPRTCRGRGGPGRGAGPRGSCGWGGPFTT